MKNANLDRETIISAAADIMRNAHRITRAAIEREPSLDYRVTLAAALRELWAEYGCTATEQIQRMTGDQLYDFILRLTWYEYKHDERISPKTGEFITPIFRWIRDRMPGIDAADTLRGIAHEAYIQLVTALANDDGETPLARYAAKAIHRAAINLQRREYKHARAIRHTIDTETGEERDVIETRAGAAAARIDGPETAAIVTDLIARACKDDKDRAVVALTVGGWTQTETAARIDIGQRAVSKRLDGIRDRLAAELGRDPRAKAAPRGKTARRA